MHEEARREDMGAIKERIDYVEALLSEYGDLRARCEQLQEECARLREHPDLEACREDIGALKGRIETLEKLFGEFVDKDIQMEHVHADQSALRLMVDTNVEVQAVLQDRIDFLERSFRDAA